MYVVKKCSDEESLTLRIKVNSTLNENRFNDSEKMCFMYLYLSDDPAAGGL